MRIVQAVQALIVIMPSLLISMLPYALAKKVGEILGLIAFYLWKKKRMIAIKNIESVKRANPLFVEDSILIARNSFKNLGISLVEIIKIYWGMGRKILNSIEVRGIENYEMAKLKNKGVIFLTGHCGNWELMALVFGLKIDKVSVVARQQNNPYLNKIIEKIRSKYGNNVIYKKGAIKKIISELKKNRSVGILADQAVLKNEGYKIDFLGLPAWTTKLPALLAQKTEAAVIPVFINRRVKGHVINIYPEVSLSKGIDPEATLYENTLKLSRYIEDQIKRYPSEWLWIHRRWKRT